MPENSAASPKGQGKRLRWARNVIKNWENDGRTEFTQIDGQVIDEINAKRYERACALILAQKLSE